MTSTTKQIVVPYITDWTEEPQFSPIVVQRADGHGIAYADEGLGDRDANGVLWARVASEPGSGKPIFGKVNSLRQRRAMRKLLCQVCAGPADKTDDGVLWVVRDYRDDWPGWPNGMGVTEPPICLPCLRFSARACPALRRGYAAIRARRYAIAGIQGLRFHPGTPPRPAEMTVVSFDHPDAAWTVASTLVRELLDCTPVDLQS
ncbi:MAG TPA: hypothetical protein VM677_28640 [Actinokineospora sp.]|jgi:hypothetical protein|nr:hypothetical protein [Actinokineospora sp.]